MRLQRLEHSLLKGGPRLYLAPPGDGGEGGGGPAGPDGATGATGASGATGTAGATGTEGRPEGITPEVAAYFGGIIAKERREAEAKAKQEAKDEAERQAAQERQRKEQADLEAKGEFDTVKQQLEQRATDAEGERDSLRVTNQKLLDALKLGVESEWKEIPETIAKLFRGAEDDYLARYEYLKDPDVQAAIKEFQDKRGVPPGNRPDPRRRDGEQNTVEQERRQLQGSGSYSAM